MRELAKAVLPESAVRLARRVADTVHARRAWARIRRPPRAPGSGPSGDELRLGLLATRFPPEVGGGAYRPSSFARYASEAGLHVTVVAARARQQLTEAGRYLAGHVPRNVTVHRAQPRAQFAFTGRFPDFGGDFLELIDMYRTADDVFRERPPQVILATGPPFYPFVAGRQLASRYRCPLVLDYRDEWSECPFDFVRSDARDLKWERRCLSAASLVIFTTDSQRAHAIEVFEELDAERCAVIPNGWEPRDWADVPDYVPAPVGDARQVVSFVGNLGDHTPPDDFFDDLQASLATDAALRKRLRFRFVGEKSERSRERLASFPWPDLMESVDQVPKSEASRLMRESSALLLLNAVDLHRYIPGKLYEYLAAGPPVLVHGQGGEVGALVERLGAGWVIDAGDPRQLATVLSGIAEEPGSTVSFRDREAWLSRHTREAAAQQMVERSRTLVSVR